MIGVSSTRFCSDNPEESLMRIAKEFDHWEIVSEGEHYLPHIMGRLKAIAPSYNMKFSVHAPISDVNIASLNERIRESSTLEIIAAMEHAIELNSDTVTFHPGLLSVIVSGQEKKSMEKAKRSIRTIDRIMNEFGVIAALENLPQMPAFGFMIGKTAKDMAELVEGTEMKICFDIGHANTVNQIDDIIDMLGDRIVNIHIHDNTGSNDDHMTIGDGNIDFKKVLSKLSKYKGRHIIESRSLESAVTSRERLKDLLGLR